VKFSSKVSLKKSRTISDKAVGQGLRRNKTQGSPRAGIHCTSSMKVEIQTDEHITVQYYPAHYGHTNVTTSDEQSFSEQNRTTNGAISYHQHEHVQSFKKTQPVDRSSSSSPGSASTSPSAGSNSNSNNLSVPIERQSISIPSQPPPAPVSNVISYGSIKANHSVAAQNSMSHCIIITPSLMLEEHPSIHSNEHHTPVFVVQQHLPSTSSNILAHPSTTLSMKKEKCVSDIMHEAFQLLSYWPLDHPHQNGLTTDNDQYMHHSHLNMDEHLMF
jgi:hypothetical protein